MADMQKYRRLGNFQKKFIKFFAEIKAELKKVIWPTWPQLVNNTVTVLLVCLIIGAIIWIADFGLTKILELTLVK